MAMRYSGPRRKSSWMVSGLRWLGENRFLVLAIIASIAISLFAFENTWKGMEGYAGSGPATGLITFGLQCLVYIFAWLLAEALVERQKLRIGLFLGGYLAVVWISAFFCFAALYYQISNPQSLVAAADLRARSLGQQIVTQLDDRLRSRQQATLNTQAYKDWNSHMDMLMKDARAQEAAISDRLVTDVLTLDKQNKDAVVSELKRQIAVNEQEIQEEIAGKCTIDTKTCGKPGCGPVCNQLKEANKGLNVRLTAALGEQQIAAGRLTAKQPEPGAAITVESLANALTKARNAFSTGGEIEQLAAAEDACTKLMRGKGETDLKGCTLAGLDNERKTLEEVGTARKLLRAQCLGGSPAGDPFQSLDFTQAMSLTDKCVGFVAQTPVNVTEEQKRLAQQRQAFLYVPQLRDSKGKFIPSLDGVAIKKVDVALNGLSGGEGKAEFAVALAVAFELAILMVACAGAEANQTARQGIRGWRRVDLVVHPDDSSEVQALKLMINHAVPRGPYNERFLEIQDPGHHPNPHLVHFFSQLVDDGDLRPPKEEGGYYRLRRKGYAGLLRRLVDAQQHASQLQGGPPAAAAGPPSMNRRQVTSPPPGGAPPPKRTAAPPPPRQDHPGGTAGDDGGASPPPSHEPPQPPRRLKDDPW